MSIQNRVKNVSYDYDGAPYINAQRSAQLRAEIDAIIDRQVDNWYETVCPTPRILKASQSTPLTTSVT